MSPKRILGLAIAASALGSTAALGATGTPERVRGTIASATADSVTVDTYADKPVTVTLTGNTSYLKVEKTNLNKVEKGSYIGTATKDVGGTQVALEVMIFPPSMRGAGAGHYASDKGRDTTLSGAAETSSSITNGNVPAFSTSLPCGDTTLPNTSAPPSRRPANLVSIRALHWNGVYALACIISRGWEIYNASPSLPFLFPAWTGLGGWLGGALAWHLSAMWLLFADGIAYLVYGFARGHFRRDLKPPPPAELGQDRGAALRFRLQHHMGHYNAVQRVL